MPDPYDSMLPALLIALAATAAFSTVAGAQVPGAQLPGVGRRVVAIEIESPDPTLVATARQAIVQELGQDYSIDAVQQSLQNLYTLGFVAQASVLASALPDGTELIFRIEPLVRLHHSEFVGDRVLSKSRLRRVLSVRDGDPIDAVVAAQQARRVQSALADDGYLLASVSATIELLDRPSDGVLRLALDAGARTRVRGLQVSGEIGIAPGQAALALGFNDGDVYRPAALEEGLDRLQATLLDGNYFFAQVGVAEQSLDLADNSMSLRIEVDAGPRVELDFVGDIADESGLQERLSMFEFGSVDDWALRESRHQLVRFLQDRGHWRPLVSYSREHDQEGRNVRVRFQALAGRKARLRRIAFAGNDSVPRSVLVGAIRSRESSFLSPARFIEEYWEADQRAVLTAYRRRGFRQARIVEAPVRFDPASDGVVATMVIEEGPQTLLTDVELKTVGSSPTGGIRLEAWAQGLELRPGGPFDPGAVRRDADRLRALLANAGYPRALVQTEVVASESAPSVSYRIVAGERATVGRVLISGNTATRDYVIRREVGFTAGAPYSFTDVLEAQSRLYGLGLFNQVDVVPAVPDGLEAEQAVVVRVREGPPMFYSYGAGFDTEERLRGLFAFGHNNLFGRNQQGSISARASLREQRVLLLLTEPYFFGRRLESTATGFYSSEKETSFDVQRFGGSFQLRATHGPTAASIFRFTFRDVNTFNIDIDPDLIDPEDQSTRVGSVGYTLLIDTRRDPIEPRDGTFTTLDIDIASRALGSNTDFVTLVARSFWYRQLGRSLVLAAGGRAGIKIPYRGRGRVPLAERFFAGGSTTLRGFPLDEAGPTDAAGNALGGEVLLVANLELRTALRGALGGVAFVDIGNVFATRRAVRWSDVREAVGVGLRYATPVGPIRLDLARLLANRTNEDRYQLFFSVGHTF